MYIIHGYRSAHPLRRPTYTRVVCYAAALYFSGAKASREGEQRHDVSTQ
jgi:hypothetical protein